jgi:GNAT superfamily N-acetyltransferase
MLTDWSVRTAGASDRPDVLALYRHLNPLDPTLPTKIAETIWQEMIRAPGTFIFLGSIGDQVVTTCMLTVIANLTRGGRPFAVIENVVTDPVHRRRGCGTSILAAAVDRAWSMDCYKVVLTTGSKNPSTWAFYERAGFKRGTRTAFEMRR